LIDKELAQIGILPSTIRGYENYVNTHDAASDIVQAGGSDVAIGIQAAAWRSRIGFIPLFEERYKLVILDENVPF